MRRAVLLARTHARQDAADALARNASLAAERAVRRQWRRLLVLLRRPPSPFVVRQQAREILQGVAAAAAEAIAGQLRQVARWAHHSTTAAILDSLAKRDLLAVARGRGLMEAVTLADLLGLNVSDANTAGEEPARSELEELLFPPIAAEQVNEVVYATGWWRRLASATSLPGATPEALASTIATGLILGRDPAEIAREIAPIVQGVQSSARRIARTESMRVASAVQMRSHDALGGLVIGYEIHATLDERTRPEHRRRDGTRYWKDPAPGQKGLDQMPRPPMEADGSYAWNCRCYLTPILKD